MELHVDPERLEPYAKATGLYVRARLEGKMGNYDIAQLDTDSLHTFLRSRGQRNTWAESVVAILLNHKMEGTAFDQRGVEKGDIIKLDRLPEGSENQRLIGEEAIVCSVREGYAVIAVQVPFSTPDDRMWVFQTLRLTP